MIPTTEDFLQLIERIAPMKLAEPWDNPGLQIGDSGQRIKKIFSALDPTPEALIHAADIDAQILFTHHPLIFKSVSRIEINAYPGSILARAARRRISIVCAHTNLDVAKGGINDILANVLGLQDVEILLPNALEPSSGLGRVGNLPAPLAFDDFMADVMERLGTDHIQLAGPTKKSIRRVAVVGGSGGSLLPHAVRRGADVLLTGDIGHHTALEAKFLDIALIDGGHFHTEKIAFRIFCNTLGDSLKKEGWETQIETDGMEVNPVRILSGN